MSNYSDTKGLVSLCLLSSRCPSHYVYSSEQSAPSPAASGGDADPETPGRALEDPLEQEAARHKVSPGHDTVFMTVFMTRLWSTLWNALFTCIGLPNSFLIIGRC